MKKLILVILGLALGLAAFAQADKSEVRRGNREFSRGHFSQADIHYRKALLADSLSVPAAYNLANTLYRENNLEEAGRVMEGLQPRVLETDWAAYWWFNTGDIALGAKDYAKAAQAFKEVLKLEPDNMEAKENYIYARMMQKNQEQNQQQDQQNQDQDQQQDQQDQNQDQDQNQNDDQEDQQDQDNQQGQQPQMTPQQMQQILRAIQAKEQETQDKVNKEKAEAMRSRQSDRNW